MSATEDLRRMLDERGVEYYEHEAPASDCIAFFDGVCWHDCWGSVGDEVNVTLSLTPEQAIAITFGDVNLAAENSKLRTFLGGGSIVTDYWKDEDGTMHVLTTDGEHIYEYMRGGLADENAKLRELCKEWYRFARELFDEFIGEPEADEDFMTLEDRLRKAGVEPY